MSDFINTIIGKICNIEKKIANRNILIKSLKPIGKCATIGNIDNKFYEVHTKELLVDNIKVWSLIPNGECATIGSPDNKFCEIHTKELFVDNNTIHFVGNGKNVNLSANNDGTLSIMNNNIVNTINSSTRYTYLQEGNVVKKFDGNILKLDLPFYKKKGMAFEITNSIFKSSIKKQKIMIKINILYKWVGISYPPRFNFSMMVNDKVYISRIFGIADDVAGNYFILNSIIDINHNDTIKFVLRTGFEKDMVIEIINNSYYIIKTL